jgi:hypothetical protein
MKYKDRVAKIVSNVATQLDIADSDVHVQLYDTTVETDTDLDTASGKVLLTYNPDIFKDNTAAAYQVWAGALVKEEVIANDQINTAFMQVSLVSLLHILFLAMGEEWSYLSTVTTFTTFSTFIKIIHVHKLIRLFYLLGSVDTESFKEKKHLEVFGLGIDRLTYVTSLHFMYTIK